MFPALRFVGPRSLSAEIRVNNDRMSSTNNAILAERSGERATTPSAPTKK